MRRSMYSTTSCSGLMITSTGSASCANRPAEPRYSCERTRAILVGVWNSV